MSAFTEPKIVIVVFGSQGTGKSTLLKEFISQVDSKCIAGTQYHQPKRGKRGVDDKMSCIYKDVKIGIATKGDTAKEIFENFDFFQQHQCRIVVTAVHKGEDTSTEALDLIVNHYSMVRLRDVEKVKEDEKTFKPKTSPQKAPEFTAPLAELSKRLDDAVSILSQLDIATNTVVQKQVIVVNQ